MGILAPEDASERVRSHRLMVERDNRHRPALARREETAQKRFRGVRDPDGNTPFWEIIRDVLWAAGVVEIQAGFYARGVVRVLAESLLPREEVRPDRACEILEQAERVLRAAGYRTGIAWDRDPPRLHCTTPRAETDLFG
jgi:hypothetical protein